MNNKTVLITGMNGFIGTQLGNVLRDSFPDLSVFGLSRSKPKENQNTFVVDLLDKISISKIVRETSPGYIFHLAGLIYSTNFEDLYRANVTTTINLLDAVKECKLRSRVIIPSSAAEYGHIKPDDLPVTEKLIPNPVSPYGVAKAWQTTVARYYSLHGVDVVIGRVFNVIGREVPLGLSIGAFASQLKKIKHGELPPQILVGNLQPKRDFIDINDACRGLIALAEKGECGEIYNICSGKSISMETILKMMIEEAGLTVDIKVDPSRVKGMDIEDIYGTNRKITSETGWHPMVPIEKSIEHLME